MDKNLDHIANFIKASQEVPEAEKQALLKALKAVDKQIQILDFKLDRTEKVKRTTSILLEETIAELEQKRSAVEEALAELQATQKQLIHAEKMASLGELTAGIAHEIQNPLNFVNNFSEVSHELIDEMNEELAKGAVSEAKEIAGDLKQNLEKITHHGKRADSIVKGMLQHSRSSEGRKESTDINALVDEYLRLAYHGLRAKDKSFNTEIITQFDESLPKVAVMQQEIGRVFLNLINNAFYAVNEKAKAHHEKTDGVPYTPVVKVSTSHSLNKKDDRFVVQIAVSDNGSGIPKDIAEKIFQPFFTTKPTGQGTGLGLSLSYDILKAHGGRLSLNPEIGEGTEFIIELPGPGSPA
jgi:signal transduction histidine kinase